jgi:cyclopropane fatty-acyl-phospholipid synthase-like methyltransferase
MVVVPGISRSMTTDLYVRRYCATKIWDEDWHKLGEHYEKILLAWHKKFGKTWLQLVKKI